MDKYDYIYHEIVGRNPNCALILLTLGLDYTDLPNLIDIQISEEGEKITVFCKDLGHVKESARNQHYITSGASAKEGYYNYYYKTPQEAIKVMADVCKSDKGTIGELTCEERIDRAHLATLGNVPSEFKEKKVKEMEALYNQAEQAAREQEMKKKTGLSSDGIPEAATEGLREHLREEVIEDIASGRTDIRMPDSL